MTKALVPIPIAVLAATVAGYGICRLAGRAGHGHEAVAAAVICVVSGTLASLPAMMARRSDVLAASQAGLFGTLGHLFLTLVLAALAWMTRLSGERQPFLLWLLCLYWISLMALVGIIIRVIRQARPHVKSTAKEN